MKPTPSTVLIAGMTFLLILASLGASRRDRPDLPAPPGPALQPADLLIMGGTIITMDPQRRVLENGAIAIVGDRIAAIGPTRELAARFDARETLNARRKVVMPGS